MARSNVQDARDRFVRLAQKRVRRAIKDIRLVGNLSNTATYKYSAEDVDKIVRALTNELEKLQERFRGGDSADDIDFRL